MVVEGLVEKVERWREWGGIDNDREFLVEVFGSRWCRDSTSKWIKSSVGEVVVVG